MRGTGIYSTKAERPTWITYLFLCRLLALQQFAILGVLDDEGLFPQEMDSWPLGVSLQVKKACGLKTRKYIEQLPSKSNWIEGKCVLNYLYLTNGHMFTLKVLNELINDLHLCCFVGDPFLFVCFLARKWQEVQGSRAVRPVAVPVADGLSKTISDSAHNQVSINGGWKALGYIFTL